MELGKLKGLLELLQDYGVSEYVTPELHLRLGPAARIEDFKSDDNKTKEQPAGFKHPSLWPGGAAPEFPRQ